MSRKFEVAKGYESQDILLPKRASSGSAGYDFRALEGAIINSGETKLFHTGIKAKMEMHEVLILAIRSSLGVKKNLTLANGIGIIDADYYGNPDNDGEIGVALYNRGKEPVEIKKGERIAQGIFLPYLTTEDDECTSSRTGGFGSSGTL